MHAQLDLPNRQEAFLNREEGMPLVGVPFKVLSQ
jgi:hypothetical protein